MCECSGGEVCPASSLLCTVCTWAHIYEVMWDSCVVKDSRDLAWTFFEGFEAFDYLLAVQRDQLRYLGF